MNLYHKTDYVAKMKPGDYLYYETRGAHGWSGVGLFQDK
jgi:hypothetical protein